MKHKHIILLALITCLAFSGFAQVEDGLEQKHAFTAGAFLKVDSLSNDQISLWPEIYGTYESNLSKHLTGYFRLNIIIPSSIDIKFNPDFDDGIEKHSSNGFGISLGTNYYIKEAFHGFYAGPSLSFYRYNHIYHYTNSLKEEEYSITSFRGSLIVGYQHISDYGFVFDIYIAAMLEHKSNKKFISPIETIPYGSNNLIKPDIGISIGYFF